VEARDPVHPGAVGHRDGREPERGGALRDRLRLRGALEEGERSVCVELAIPGTGDRGPGTDRKELGTGDRGPGTEDCLASMFGFR
jgi:hypothetical protein